MLVFDKEEPCENNDVTVDPLSTTVVRPFVALCSGMYLPIINCVLA